MRRSKADAGPAVEGDGDGEDAMSEGSGEGDGGTKGAGERGGEAPEVEHLGEENNVWDFLSRRRQFIMSRWALCSICS